MIVDRAMDSWEYSLLDESQLNEIAKLESYLIQEYETNELNDLDNNKITTSETDGNNDNDNNEDDIEAMKNIIVNAESSCHLFVERIDEALQNLSELSTSYSDVTSRTNTLMQSCEDLLEQQVT